MSDGRKSGEGKCERATRRRVLGTLSAAAVSGLAGCGFGGDGDETTIPPITTLPPERTPTETPTATATPTPTEEPRTTTQPTTTTQGIVEGRTWQMFVPPPNPGDAQYNPITEHHSFWFDGRAMMRADLFHRSLIDLEYYPEAAREWNYANGVLTVELHDDLYWVSDSEGEVSPVNVTADDWVTGTWFIEEDFTAVGSTFEAIEKRGRYEFQVFFDTEWRRDWALDLVLRHELGSGYNRVFWASYIDRFQDATSDGQLDQVRADALARSVTSPHPVTNMPFRVRDTGEDYWQLTLRDAEDSPPRWVDQLTFDTVEIVVRPDITRQTQAFTKGDLPFAGMRPKAGSRSEGLGAFDPNVVDVQTPFESEVLTLPRVVAPVSYALNAQQPPTSNIHFRRAMAYLLDRSAHLGRFMEGDRILTGFINEPDEDRYISSDFLDTLRTGPHDNYGFASVETARAEAEMEAGGFERNSAGDWLYQSGEQSGDPITLDVPAWKDLEPFVQHAKPFVNTLSSFGIDINFSVGTDAKHLAQGDFALALTYWGGRIPHATFGNGFGYTGFGQVLMGDLNFPEAWEGPPMGEFASPPAVAGDTTETYNVRGMITALPEVSDGLFQSYVDRLAWVFNQSMVRLPVGHQPWIWSIDTDTWSWPLPTEENPKAWTSIPRRKLWQRGFVGAVPEDSG